MTQGLLPTRTTIFFALASGLWGCTPPVPTGPQAAPSNDTGVESPSPASTQAETASNQKSAAHPLTDGRAADLEHALPELHMEHLGMHLGGEANTPQAKAPFLDAIMQQEEAFLQCYSLVSEPEKGGSFGVDLFVKKEGGTAEIRGVRQKIGGNDFVECMNQAFLEVHFGAAPRPTVFSYSLLYVMERDT